MSLQVWLPLNNTSHNQGILGDVMAWNGTVSYVDGKMGKAMNSTAGNLEFTFAKIPTVMSVAFWVCPNAPDAWSDIFSYGQLNNRFEKDNATGTYRWYGTTDQPNLIANGSLVANSCPNSEWNHIVITIDGTNVKCYRNGTLVYTIAQANPLATSFGTGSKFTIGCGGGDSTTSTYYTRKYKGYLNDFRVYDHVLSLREIKEISKGLVLHYKLDNQYNITATNLLQSIKIGNFPTKSGQFTATTKTDTDGTKYTNYKLSYTGTGSSAWPYMRSATFAFTAGKTYWWTAKVRWNSGNATANIRRSRIDNDWEAAFFTIQNSSCGGKWTEVKASYVLKTTDTRGGASITTNPYFEIYTQDLKTSGTVYTIDFDIKDVAVYESNSYNGFIDNTLKTSSIDDCSGFRNNGTVTGTIEMSTNVAKYQYAMNTLQTGYVKNDAFGLKANKWTISFWLNPTKQSASQQHFLFGTFDSWTNNGVGMWSDDSSASTRSYNIVARSEGSSSYTGATTAMKPSFTCGYWAFFAMTYDGTNLKTYKDGTLLGSVAASGTVSMPICYVGNSKFGTSSTENENVLINDFRIYATALSADDVLALYKVKEEIDKSANVYGGLLQETTITSFDKKGVINAKGFNEMNVAFDTNIRIEPDGSAWIHLFHHNNPKSNPFASTDPFTSIVRKSDNAWFNMSYCNKINQNGKWEILYVHKATSGTDSSEQKFRWIQSKNPMTATFADVAAANITKVTGYASTTYGGLYKINANTYLCCNNGTNGNWCGAVGMWSQSWNSGALPSINGVAVTTGYVDVYVRIDQLTTDSFITTASISKSGNVSGRQLIEY